MSKGWIIALTLAFAALAVVVAMALPQNPESDKSAPAAANTASQPVAGNGTTSAEQVSESNANTEPAPTPDYSAANAYSLECGGLSLLIYKQDAAGADTIRFEAYAENHSAGKAHYLASGTKSFWGVLAMIAVGEGMIDLDEMACDSLTEWKDDARKSKITVRHLLNLTSGLWPGTLRLQGQKKYSKFEEVLRIRSRDEPGSKFTYGPSHYYAFGEVMRRKLAKLDAPMTLTAYLHAKLLDPLGITVSRWSEDTTGEYNLPYGAWLTAREWAKFGLMLLHNGWAGEKQVIAPELLAQCLEGSEVNPGYGLTFWLNHGEGAGNEAAMIAGRASGLGSEFPDDLYMAAGKDKQRLYVIPSMGAVIVRQGNQSHPVFDDREFLRLALPELEMER